MKFDSARDEFEYWQKADELAYEHEQQEAKLTEDECYLDSHLVGKLSELPLWARAYIVQLRRDAKEGV